MSKPLQSWGKLARAKDILIEPKGILVNFADGRSHRVLVIDQPDHWILRGLVVRQASVAFDPEPMLAAATRNRQLRLCGLSVDVRGNLWGQSMVPKAGLDAHEFQLCARHLAAECDRLEYLLTGRDREKSSR
ncbi:MAG: hypothetical protein ABIS50_00550 [Luteolibacter sp.]|uniref:hypothetical protein n=1 Tax=Luteolibacter sp. TaxID=1962973 RepID=UPI0032670F90